MAVVIDKDSGDTIPVCIRLWGVDCPECCTNYGYQQPYGEEAKRFTEDLIKNTKDSIVSIKIVSHTKGKNTHRKPINWKNPFVAYGRLEAEVIVGGKNLGIELLKRGLAMLDTTCCKDSVYRAAEKVARKNKLNIWSENSPITPWE